MIADLEAMRAWVWHCLRHYNQEFVAKSVPNDVSSHGGGWYRILYQQQCRMYGDSECIPASAQSSSFAMYLACKRTRPMTVDPKLRLWRMRMVPKLDASLGDYSWKCVWDERYESKYNIRSSNDGTNHIASSVSKSFYETKSDTNSCSLEQQSLRGSASHHWCHCGFSGKCCRTSRCLVRIRSMFDLFVNYNVATRSKDWRTRVSNAG